jgi:hypothetical protein
MHPGKHLLRLSLVALLAFSAEGLAQNLLGNSFFEAVRDGGLEAAKELGGVDVIYQGPSTPTAEGQIEIITNLIAQNQLVAVGTSGQLVADNNRTLTAGLIDAASAASALRCWTLNRVPRAARNSAP